MIAIMILDAPRLAAMRADVLDLARRRRWRVPDERDLMVEWFVPGRGGPQGRKRVRHSQLQRLLSRPVSTRFG